MVVSEKVRFILLAVVCQVYSILTYGSLKMEEFGKGSETYWLIYDPDYDKYSENLVVFLHGYGASNPGCYGGWINEIASEGYLVLFPKFQTGLFFPRERKFQERTDMAIEAAVNRLSTDRKTTIKSLTFISHSIGGIISANLADQYGRDGSFDVGGIVLVQPGFQYARLGRQSNYESISGEVMLLSVTGEKDKVAGDAFVKHVMMQSPQIDSEKKLWLKHHPDKHEGEKITAKHKDPVSPLRSLRARNRNIVIRGLFCSFAQPIRSMSMPTGGQALICSRGWRLVWIGLRRSFR